MTVVRIAPALTDDDVIAFVAGCAGPCGTMDVANRYGWSMTDARRRLRAIERRGGLTSEMGTWSGMNSGGQSLIWRTGGGNG